MKLAKLLGEPSKYFERQKEVVNDFKEEGMSAGVVEVDILPNQKGRVKVMGSWWPAKCQDNILIKQGQKIHVVGIENITLLVVPGN